MQLWNWRENAPSRPKKAPEDRLVTLSVRIPGRSLELLDRVIEGEIAYLKARRLPAHGVNRSAAFRAVWELGELEYLLQRATLWVTRRVNRYSVEQGAQLLGWDPEHLRRLLQERGVGLQPPSQPAPNPHEQPKA